MPRSFDDFLKFGENPAAPENTWFRQVMAYWEDGASLILRGAVHRDLFMDWNQEMLFVYAKVKPYLSQIRTYWRMPQYLERLEKCVTSTPELRKQVAKIEQRLKEWSELPARAAKT